MGDTIAVEVQSNIDYEVTISESAREWISRITLSKSLSTSTLHFAVQPNPGYSKRFGEIIIKDKSGSHTDTLRLEQAQQDAIVLTNKHHDVTASGSSLSIEVQSNVDYETEITPESAKTWVIPAVSSKALTTSVLNYTILPNTTYSDREASIIIHDKFNRLTDTVTIFQRQNDALILNEHAYTVPAVGDTLSVEVQSNIDYDVTISESAREWISRITLSKSLTTSTLHFAVQPNPGYTKRSGEIIIKDKSASRTNTIWVEQAQRDTIMILSQREFEVEWESCSLGVILESNTGLQFTSNADWIKVDANGFMPSTSSNIILEISENTTSAKRTGTITIRNSSGMLSETLTVAQKVKTSGTIEDFKEEQQEW